MPAPSGRYEELSTTPKKKKPKNQPHHTPTSTPLTNFLIFFQDYTEKKTLYYYFDTAEKMFYTSFFFINFTEKNIINIFLLYIWCTRPGSKFSYHPASTTMTKNTHTTNINH